MSSWGKPTDDLGQIPPRMRLRNTDEQIIQARRACAQYATDADELREFLDALGLL